MECNETFLECKHCSQDSFYKKALVVIEGNEISLISYTTTVCIINKKNKRVMFIDRTHSSTTNRHIKEFLLQTKAVLL